MTVSTDPHVLLGVPVDASQAEITDAYRVLAQIYHPDRYADAPPRVQAEATARMQALNAAYAELRAVARPAGARRQPTERTPAPPPPPPPPPRPQPQRTATVLYVDGAKGYHNDQVAPLGVVPHDASDEPMRCGRLDAELRRWFETQQRSAGAVDRKRYASWDRAQRQRYAAKVGCSRVPRDTARSFGVPCPECRP